VQPANASPRGLSRLLVAAAVGLLALGFSGFSDLGGATAEAKEGTKGRSKGTFEHGCRVQAPQKSLMRRTFLKRDGTLDMAKHTAAVRYLSERYGHVDNEATRSWNKKSAQSQSKLVRFMGLPITVHDKIAPALACVEKRIRQTCGARYTPHALSGLRTSNTYRGVEVSNHLFGIAVDIDPDRNPCCGCVDPWPSNPICKNQGPVFKRTALPKCYIRAFERFGFDWLGHDKLEDTMHFEFLGDPDRIRK
jgi:hypothetical protein